jgi:hypothetical protein
MSEAGQTTKPGYQNRNGQIVVNRTELRGNDNNQYVYRLRCSTAVMNTAQMEVTFSSGNATNAKMVNMDFH